LVFKSLIHRFTVFLHRRPRERRWAFRSKTMIRCYSRTLRYQKLLVRGFIRSFDKIKKAISLLLTKTITFKAGQRPGEL
jgi:hypothetical protein